MRVPPLAAPLLAVLLAAGPAVAAVTVLPEKAEAGPAMQAYAATPAYKALLAQAVARVPATVLPRCPKLAVEDGAIILQGPVQFGPDKVPASGGWRHSRPAAGCGTEILLNFFFFPAQDRRILTVVGLPGTTRTELTQQRDGRNFILIALDRIARECRQFETVNTVFGGFGTRTPELADPGAAAEFRPWWETWTVLGCGKRYAVPVNFLPNRLGTQIVQPGGIEAK